MLEQNKSIVRQWYESFDTGQPNYDLVHADFVNHMQIPGFPPALEGVKASFDMWFKAFSDVRMSVDDMVAEGDKVATRYSARMKHTGEFLGVAATGKEVTLIALEILRIKDGKLAEHWEVWDTMGLMQQLGVDFPGQVG